ncbi:MAG: hypothetical protein IPL49_06215 [Saprospirales bacterium]|nr:hypothetical protein [Saprospirales bacterium]MBK8490501.1 hypothetical protein [Saprospirales bacterium]
MTTTNVNPSPNATPNQARQRLIAIAAVIVAALLIVNGILLYSWLSQKKVAAQTTADLEESERLREELDLQYNGALADLEDMRGKNDELNALIDSKEAELKDARDKIDRMIKNDLPRAKSEIKTLKTQLEGYVAEINDLKAQNAQLAESNTALQEEKSLLTSDLEQSKMTNEELAANKAALVSEKEELSARNQDLSKTVNFASVVKVEDLEVTGLATRDSGKAVKKSAAKNVDQLEICFNTTANEVARPGSENFYIRLISPTGETLAIEELGSGIMTSSKTNEKIRYTQMTTADYSNDASRVCASWTPGQQFQEGTYQVEVYNKGFLAGTSTFKLR